MTLTNEEFTRRFAQHILPHRFVRIRHYGILSSTWKRGKLTQLQFSLKIERKQTPVKALLRKCPCCKTGKMRMILTFEAHAPPPIWLMKKYREQQMKTGV